MRVLVLGATGRLGRMVRWGWQGDHRLAPLWQGRDTPSGATWRQFDILCEPAALEEACAEADVVLCLAGITPASAEPLDLNTDLGLAVVKATSKPVLLASSASVYGRAGRCREVDVPLPIAPYGEAKLAMERKVLAAATGPVTCLRIGNVAGADQILGRTVTGGPVTLDSFNDGRTPARSYIGPLSLSRVLAELCLMAPQGLPNTLNVAAPGIVEMGELLDAIPYPWQQRPAPPEAIAEVLLDTDRLNRFIALDPSSGRAETLVQEWRAFRAETETE